MRLLRDAGRQVEWARVFTVDWVFEAAALGIPYEDMSDSCAEALRQGTALRDWKVMLDLACATETLERWQETCELDRAWRGRDQINGSAGFLHTELFVRPLADWQMVDLHEVVQDAETAYPKLSGPKLRRGRCSRTRLPMMPVGSTSCRPPILGFRRILNRVFRLHSRFAEH